MSPPLHSRLPSRQPNLPSRQRGAIGLIAAVTLGFSLLFLLLVVDSGRLYMEKRKLQRIADTAALEAVSRKGTCVAPALTATAYATQSATRNGFTVTSNSPLTVACGSLVTGSDNLRTLAVDPSKSSAVRVIVSRPVVTSVAAGVAALFAGGTPSLNTRLTATAVAAAPAPLLAQLSIRSTVANIDLLNPLFKALLGGSVTLDVASWQNLLTANISLLKFLDLLATELNVSAGNYDQLLTTNATIAQLFKVAAIAAQAGGVQSTGTTANIATSLGVLRDAALNVTTVTLGDILKLQTGSQSAGLDTQFGLFQLIQGFAQLSNYKNSVAAEIPVNLLGLGVGATAQLKVTQPPQFSAIGNPAVAKSNPTGASTRIFVRTAQVRAFVTLDLSLVTTLTTLVSGLLSVPTALLGFDLRIIPDPILNVSIEAGGGNAYVTDYSCISDTNKSLTISATSEAARLRIGKVNSDWTSSLTPMTVTPMTLVDIGLPKTCPSCSRTPYAGGGTDLQIDMPILTNTLPYTFINPPLVTQPPQQYFSISATNAVSSLSNSVSGIALISHTPTFTPNVLQVVLFNTLIGVVNTVVNLLSSTLSGLLGPLLDSLINNLLLTLGINLNKVDVGGNLSCGQPGLAYLVI